MNTPLNNQLTPIQEEAAFLRFLSENFTTNPKKLKQLALRESANHPENIRIGILASILRSRDPVGYLQECFKQAFDYPHIIEEFIEAGNHGMIVVNENVYPVKINARANWLRENDKWNADQELDIQHDLVEAWMIEHKATNFKGKIALFPFHGFTGLFRRINKARLFGKFV